MFNSIVPASVPVTWAPACSTMGSIRRSLKRRSIALQVLTHDNVTLLADTEICTLSSATTEHGEFYGVPHYCPSFAERQLC